MTCGGGGWCGLPHSPGAWAWLGLLLSWGAATPFWNSLSLLDKELSVLCSNSLGLRVICGHRALCCGKGTGVEMDGPGPPHLELCVPVGRTGSLSEPRHSPIKGG